MFFLRVLKQFYEAITTKQETDHLTYESMRLVLAKFSCRCTKKNNRTVLPDGKINMPSSLLDSCLSHESVSK